MNGWKRSWLVLGALAIVGGACTRTANQTNFIGEPCTSQGDCPPELLCIASACRERCGPGGTCKNAGEVCQLGACVPGALAEGADSGTAGGAPTDPGDSDIPPGGSKSDGTLVIDGLPYTWDFGVDDERFVYVSKVTDPFGATTTELRSRPLDGGAEITVLSTTEPGGITPTYVNGYVYFTQESHDPPPSKKLLRVKADTPNAVPEAPIATMPLGGGPGGPLTVVGDDLYFVDQNNALRRYDTKAGTLDPTAYGDASYGHEATRLGATIYWLNDENNGKFAIWKAEVGAVGAATGISIPTPPGSGYLGMGAFGTKVFVAAESGNSNPGNIVAVDTTALPNGNPTVLFSGVPNGAPGTDGVGPVVFDGDEVFVATYEQTGETGTIVRVALATGATTKFATYLAQGSTKPIGVTPTTVYWVEHSGSGMRLVKKAR